MRVIPVIQVARALALTALCFSASSLAAGSGNTTNASAAPPAGNAHALLGAKSWGGAVDVHVSGPYELKLHGPDGSAHLGSTRLSSTLRVTFHFDKLIQVDEFSATWAGSAHWSVSEHEYYEVGAKGQPLEWGPSEASGDATTKASFSINFPEETGKGPGYWSIDLGDPSFHYRGTISDIAGRTETWSGKGTTEALNALEETDLGGRLSADGYIHGTKVETQESRLAEARARIKKDIPPSMGSLQKSFEKLATIEYEHPAGPDSQVVMPKSAVHWTILPDPCTGEDRRIRIAHAVFKKDIVFDSGGPNDSELGQAGIDPAQYASMAEAIDWSFPTISGLQVAAGRGTLCNPTLGCTFEVQFKGMPSDNSGYGRKKVSLSLLGFESCVKPKSLKVGYFYTRDGNDNPKGSTEPNWFYYWSQTPAAAAARKLLVRIVYSGDKAGCSASGGIVGGYFASWGDVIANPSEDQAIHLCAGLVQIKWTNPITGRTTSGIDAYGVTVLHELAHKRHFDEWFRAIVHEIGEAERLHNRRLENKLFNEALALDRDGDDIPDRLECHRSKKTGREYCPRWRGIKAGIFDSCGLSAAEHLAKNQNALPAGERNGEASDEHCLIFRYDEPKWRLGSANRQDWACPGKQSGNRCGPEVASEEESSGARKRTREGTRSAASGVEPLSYGRSSETPRKSTHAAKAPSEQHGAKRGVAAPTPETTRAAALLRSANPLAQARGLDALGRGNGVTLHERLALMLPGLKRAIAAPNPEQVPFYTGFLPRQDWIRLQYVAHLSALGPASLPALRAARQKAMGTYREYLTLALVGAGDKHSVRLLTPLVKAGSDWIIRRQAVLLVGAKAGTRADVQKLLKTSLHDPAKIEWRSDAGGPVGFKRHLHPVRDAAALMLYDAGYAIDRTPAGGYVAVWTPAVPRLAHTPETVPVAASSGDGMGVNRQMKP